MAINDIPKEILFEQESLEEAHYFKGKRTGNPEDLAVAIFNSPLAIVTAFTSILTGTALTGRHHLPLAGSAVNMLGGGTSGAIAHNKAGKILKLSPKERAKKYSPNYIASAYLITAGGKNKLLSPAKGFKDKDPKKRMRFVISIIDGAIKLLKDSQKYAVKKRYKKSYPKVISKLEARKAKTVKQYNKVLADQK